MIFTREDILKILNALLQLGRKDSEFKDANAPLNSNDEITILQDGINKKVSINNLLSTLGLLKKDDFINVSDRYDEYYIQLSEAITIIAKNKRKKGLVITFLNLQGDWKIFQFDGELNNFSNTDYWKDLFDFKYPIVNSILPDEEDLTLTLPNEDNNSFIKLKDKEYDTTNFSGMGTKIIRKNVIEITLDDGTIKRINYLSQDVFNSENTIYIIKYDFTLDGDITIPANCALKFDGGSLKNGTLIWNNTIIYGNFFEHIFNIKFGSNFFAPDILYINVDMFGADPTGQIDSIEAINNAIEYVSRNKLNIPIYFTNNGVYYITDNIICRDYTTLIGNGSTFKYKWVYGIDEEYKSCTIISNYRIDATNNIRLIGGNTHISIKGFNFDIVNGLNYFDVEGLRIPNGAITFYDVDYLEISEIYYTFKNNVQPIWTEGCSHIDIHDCTLIKEIKDGDTEDLNATVSSGIWIMNNNIRDVSDIRIHNNYIVGRRDECIAIQSMNCHTRNIYIYDNTLYNNYVMNISITPRYKEVNSVEPIMHNINIYNNRLYGGFVSLRKGQEDIKIYNNYFSNKDIYARIYASRLAFVLIDSTTDQNSINSTLNRISIFDNFIEIGQEETDSVKPYVVYIIALTTNINIYNNIVVSTSSALFSRCILSDGASRVSLCNNDIRVKFTYLLYSQNNASNLIIKDNIVEALSCIMYVNLRNNIIAQNLNIVNNKINNVIGSFNFVLSNEDSGFSLTYNDICFISGNVIRSGAQIKSPAKSLGNLMSVNQSAIVTNAPNYISRNNIETIKSGDIYDGKVIILNGSEIPTSLSYYYAGKYRSFDGCLYDTRRSGALGQRPIGTSIYVGFVYFDTSLTPKRPIWASEINGDTVTWVDATGTPV